VIICDDKQIFYVVKPSNENYSLSIVGTNFLDIFRLEELEANENSIAFNLVEAMLHIDSAKRPTANAVIKHPYFWDAAKRLTFFQVIFKAKF